MGDISTGFVNTFRDFIVAGVPASGRHEPRKADIRALALPIEAGIAAAALSGTNLTAAMALVAPLLQSAQAAQAAAEQVVISVPASVAAQLDLAVADATQEAKSSRDAARLAAETALASSRYFPTRAAGEAASATGQFFSTSLNGTVIYYEKTASGSIEVGRALTQAVLPVLLVDVFPSARAAYDALPPAGGTLLFGAKRYDPLTPTPGQRLTKPNVRIIGSGRPKVAANRSRYEDGTGTIITGPLYFWGDNFEITDCGIDSGVDVCSGRYGGVAQDGLMSFKLDQIAWNEVTSPNSKGLTVRNVGALCQSPGAPVHAMLLEAYDHADVSNVEVTYGLHGFVGKLRFSNIRGVRAFGNAGGGSGEGEGFLLKGNTYAPLAQVNAAGIVVEGGVYPADNGIGIQLLSETPGSGGVTISDFKVYSKAKGIDLAGNMLVDNIISSGLIETCPIGVSYGDGIKRNRVAQTVINNSERAVICIGAGDISNSFNSAQITNVSGDAAIDVSASRLNIDDVHFENVLKSGSHCIRVTTGRVRIGRVLPKAGTILSLANSTPDLLNGWTAVSGNGTAGNSPSPWLAIPKGDGLFLNGVLQPGSSDTLATLPEWLRPTRDFYFGVRVISGATEEDRRGVIQTDGAIRIIARPTETGSLVFMDGIFMPDTFLPI